MEDSDPVRGEYTTMRGRVAMLVTNPCVNDSRVIRAAEVVAAKGFEVIVLATAAPGVPDIERKNGVLYRRLGATLPSQLVATPAAIRPRPQQSPMGCAEAAQLEPEIPVPVASALLATSAAAIERSENVRPPAVGQVANLRGENDPARRIFWKVLRRLYRVLLLACRRGKAIVRRLYRRLVNSVRRLYRRLLGIVRNTRRGMRTRFSRGVQVVRRQVGTAAATQRTELLFQQALDELRPDVIHAHDFVTLPAAARSARRLGALCIYDSHELEMHRNIRRGRFDRWLCGRIERRYIRQADAVVTVCDSIADHLAYAYDIRRPEVVMNAPDVGSLAPIGRDVRSDIGLSPETPLAIYVGRITIGRGIEKLARALTSMPETHLALLGAVNAPTLAAATEIVREEGTADRFHPLPPVPPSAVLPYIASADVSVIPIENICLSYYFCLPNKLLESTMAGLPVVVSDFPEMRRYVELGRCGLTMNVDDPVDIAGAVREAFCRRAQLRPDSERRSVIEARYGWDAQRATLIDLYERLVRSRRRTAATTVE